MKPLFFLVGAATTALGVMLTRWGWYSGWVEGSFIDGAAGMLAGPGACWVGLCLVGASFRRPVVEPYTATPPCSAYPHDKERCLTAAYSEGSLEQYPEGQRDSIAEYWERVQRDNPDYYERVHNPAPVRQPVREEPAPAPYIEVEPRRGLPAGQEWRRLEGHEYPALPEPQDEPIAVEWREVTWEVRK